MDREQKLKEVQRLLARVAELERSIAEEEAVSPDGRPAWAPQGYYLAYHLMAGIVLGALGAIASLLFNVVGSMIVGLHPLQLIRVYMTFPFGEGALTQTNAVVLAIGCCLYMATGAIYGMIFHYVLTRHFPRAEFSRKFVVTSVIALGIWLVNFYAILAWLQPALFDGNWIISEIPWYVGLATHLVFGWTMLAVGTWGEFERHETAGATN